MAEFLFHESVISAPGPGEVFLRVYADDVTGRPARIEAGNTMPGARYNFFIGLADRSLGFSLPVDRPNLTRQIPPGIQSLIDTRCAEGQSGCVADWICGLEGA